MNVIECQGLSKYFQGTQALKDLTFTIEENKITGLIGRNGAGKTTLLKIIAGFYQKSTGELKVFSEDPFNSLKVSANTIFIDENMSFSPGLNLRDILVSAGNFYENWDAELANRLFEYFGFDEKQLHHRLSKGMKSTFNSILGLAARCPLTIFDEPTTGMDAAVRKDFYRAVLKDYLQFPRTMILSSHLLNEIEEILEDILLINQGENFLQMAVADLREYAVGLRGKTEKLEEVTKHKKIIHKETFGIGDSFMVVENDFTQGDLNQIRMMGIDVSSIATTDLCIFLTAKNQGGIDDVFSRN